MGRSQRRKGHDFERAVARRARELGFEDAKRNPQSRDGSEDAPDVSFWCIDIECKKQKQPNIRAAFRQACLCESEGRYPVAVTQADRDMPLATLGLDDLLELMLDAKRWRDQCESQ